MKKLIFFAISVSLAISLCSASTFAVDLNRSEVRGYGDVSSMNVALNLMGGRGSVLRSGTDIRLTYRVTEDAYVIIYNIDSEGYINLLYPHDGKLKKAEKYTVYTLPERGSGVEFKTGAKTGVEYIHVLAVRNLRDIDSQELYFLSQNNRFSREKRFRTDMDPYLTMNRIDETLIKDIEDNLPATDQTYFFVNERVDFPDYLCEDGCDDVTIERNFYDQRLEYPYPPLYNMVEIEDDKYYSYDNYYDDNLSNDWDDEVMGYDDTDIHLSLNLGYGGYRYYDPFWGYYPYGYNNPWHSTYYDPFYWGWGVGSIGFWWGFQDPWYDYYWYRTRYAYWRNPCWNCYYPYYSGIYYVNDHRSRSIYAGRSFRRSRLDYRATLKKVKTRESISRSRLARTRVATRTARRLENSRISRALSRRTVRNTRDIRSSSLRKYTPRTRTVYTGKARRVNRDNPRTRGSNSRTSRTIRNLRRKSSSPDRSPDNRSRSVSPNRTKRTSPARRSSTRSSSKKSRSSSARKSTTRSRSSSSRSRSSSTRSRSSSKRSSSTRKTRSRSSSGSSRSSSKSSSRSSSRKSSRSSSSKSKRSSSGRR